MAKRYPEKNFRVEVDPLPYDNSRAACEDIADQIRRHVDGLSSGRYHRDRGVTVVCTDEPVCEHCGSRWTEDSEAYNGGCCHRDVPEPGTDEAIEEGCICTAPRAGPTDIDPPEVRLNRNCPVHGEDPDIALEARRDEALMR